MNSSLVRRALVVSLGLAIGAGVAHAGSITDTYSNGQTLTFGMMDNIKSAVNDNNTRIGAAEADIAALESTVGTTTTGLQGDVANLKGNLTGGTCVGNNASDEMVRVGSVCVDKYPASLWSSTAAGATAITSVPTNCLANGTGCTGADVIVAQSRQNSGSALKNAVSISWARAAIACANAGKRMLTVDDFLTGRAAGVVTLGAAAAEFVSGSQPLSSVPVVKPRAVVIFNNTGGAAAGDADYIVIGTSPGGSYDELNIDGASGTGFRCAR